MPQNYEAGRVISIPQGAEVNHGMNEDSDSFVLPKRTKALILRKLPGGLEILIPGHEDLSPAFWHQPEHVKHKRSHLPVAI